MTSEFKLPDDIFCSSGKHATRVAGKNTPHYLAVPVGFAPDSYLVTKPTCRGCLRERGIDIDDIEIVLFHKEEELKASDLFSADASATRFSSYTPPKPQPPLPVRSVPSSPRPNPNVTVSPVSGREYRLPRPPVPASAPPAPKPAPFVPSPKAPYKSNLSPQPATKRPKLDDKIKARLLPLCVPGNVGKRLYVEFGSRAEAEAMFDRMKAVGLFLNKSGYGYYDAQLVPRVGGPCAVSFMFRYMAAKKERRS